jgi:hypothetical protein
MAARAALLTFVGVMVSGPIGFGIVQATHPQPAWTGPARFAASYHAIQTLPFFAGFVLVGGFAWLVACLHAIADARLRVRTTCALVLTSAFAALVVLNYLVQTSFLPQLATHYTSTNDPVISTFAMANPSSLAWCVEMWAYALLGVATWLVAPVFDGSRLEHAVSWMFFVNGPLSLGSAILTAIEPAWAMTMAGLVAFMLWNGLVAAMTALAFVALRRRRRVRR